MVSAAVRPSRAMAGLTLAAALARPLRWAQWGRVLVTTEIRNERQGRPCLRHQRLAGRVVSS